MESPPRGVTILGLRFKGGIILAKERIQEPATKEHHFILTQPWETFQITKHIGMAPTGLSGDFLLLKNTAIKEAQTYQTETGNPIPIEELTNRLALFIHSYTTKKDIRPLGLLALIGGIDNTGPHLYVLDPSGTYREVLTWSEGTYRDETNTILKDGYTPNQSLNTALALTIKALLRNKTRKPEELNAVVIETKTKTIRKITTDEIKANWTKAFS
jgi:20S proteasome alpha/beta subunit